MRVPPIIAQRTDLVFLYPAAGLRDYEPRMPKRIDQGDQPSVVLCAYTTANVPPGFGARCASASGFAIISS